MAEDLEEKCQLFTFLVKRGGEGGCIFFFWSRWETSIIFNEVGDLKDIAHLIKYI